MSRLSRLLGKPKEYDICGEKYMLKPLNVNESMDLMFDVDVKDTKKAAKANFEMVKRMLKKSIEGVTDDEINDLPLGAYMDLVNAYMDLHNFKVDEKTVKEVMKHQADKK